MIKEVVKRYIFLIPLGLSFYILDFFIRYLNLDINFGSVISLAPSFFTLGWVCLFAGIILVLKLKYAKIFYLVTFSFFLIMLLVNYIYFNIFNTFFSFKSITMAGEGAGYFSVIFTYLKCPIILTLLISILLAILAYKFFPKEGMKKDKVIALVLIVMAFSCYASGRYFLGERANVLAWDAWNYKRNIYDDYTEPRKSLQVSGLYEYVFRDITLSFRQKGEDNTDTINYLNEYFSSDEVKTTVSVDEELLKNFKDKNVVFVLMESIDNWLITEETMPTLYKLMNESINFTNHYSPIFGGGATFNSEFTTNTGYMTPFNGGSAAYYYGKNKFPYALGSMFNKAGYKSVNEFHLNYGTFYNRKQMSEAFGYNNYYGSFDLGYPGKVAMKDAHFMTENKLQDLILPDEKFLSYIVTYSAHLPYSLTGTECQVAIESEESRAAAMEDEEMNCLKAQATNTDDMFTLLVDALEEKDILEDTIIIGIADHYAYYFSDKDRIKELKGESDDNLISKVPFFIWGSDIPSTEVSAVNSNLDVVPTIAYLFGLDHNPKYYLGNNILDPNYDGFVFFGDYSWYDGDVYYKNNQVIIGSNVEQEYIDNRNKQLNTILDINKKVLETNYFDTLSSDK